VPETVTAVAGLLHLELIASREDINLIKYQMPPILIREAIRGENLPVPDVIDEKLALMNAAIASFTPLVDQLSGDNGVIQEVIDARTATDGSETLVFQNLQSRLDAALTDNFLVKERVSALESDKIGKPYPDSVRGEIFNNTSRNTASGEDAHAEGSGTTASGLCAHAEGAGTTASGADSHTEGGGTQASSECAHAEGGGTSAIAYAAHSEGSGARASGTYSHAEGGGTHASGTAAHAEGSGAQASGESAHAEGSGAQASGKYSHAEGQATIAASEAQHAQGKYNVEDADGKFAFIIGNGAYADNVVTRSNAFAVDWDGKIYVGNTETGIDVADLLSRIEALEAENSSAD
jgi:hypothetical protein